MNDSDHRDKRNSLRASTNIPAKASTSYGAQIDVAIGDLSQSGCGVMTFGTPLTAGVAYDINIDGLEPQGARAAWAAGRRAGLKFNQALHVAVADHLARLHPRRMQPQRKAPAEAGAGDASRDRHGGGITARS